MLVFLRITANLVAKYILMRKFRLTAILIAITVVCAFNVTPQQAYALTVGEVYLGGYPICLEMQSDGPIVSAVNENYCTVGDVKKWDVIKKINGVPVQSRLDVMEIISQKELTIPLVITVLRNNTMTTVQLMPEKDVCSNKPKLGFSMKDGVSGLGTMTCMTESCCFYALGHPISDGDSSSEFVCRSGNVYPCDVCGYEKPSYSKPGRIIGRSSGSAIGEISENSRFGLKGTSTEVLYGEKVSLLPRTQVKPGKANILTTVGAEMESFEIEIVKACSQSVPTEKGMVIRVTDEDLLRRTGGILQGMSGSPIVQNGKLAGAVTHVFTNDPTQGYGVYIEWILA